MSDPGSAEGAKLWGGRFSGSVDPIMEKFNSSLRFDKIMFKEDIQGSVSYSRALEGCGLLTQSEGATVRQGLEQVLQEWTCGTFQQHPQDEDIHTANERRLKELVGDIGGKIHTGRSRNDQVATDLRLWLMNHLRVVQQQLVQLMTCLSERAEKELSVITVGYTHLQRAQPIRWSHWLLSFAWWLAEDLRRLKSCYTSADMCPLGSGAIAGSPFAIDRRALARDLGFTRITNNSMMAVADRDFVSDYLYWSCTMSSHLSRLAEDLSLFASSEFGFISLSDAYTTGSSLMPQKKNPDSVELIRGKAGRLIGRLTGFLCVLKGLPSTYNKDLQEDKEALFDAATTVSDILQVTAGVIGTLKVNEGACRSALSEDMLATDVAYYLVRKGMAFRTAHGKAGEIVKLAERLQCPFSKIPLLELQKVSPLFSSDVSGVWSVDSSVEQYAAEGGTARPAVASQIQTLTDIIQQFSFTD